MKEAAVDEEDHLHGHGIRGRIALFCVLVAATVTGYWLVHEDFPARVTKHMQTVAETELG